MEPVPTSPPAAVAAPPTPSRVRSHLTPSLRLSVSASLLIALALPTPAAHAAAAPTSTSLFEAFFLQRHPETGDLELLGTGIIWLLLLLSALCLGLMIQVALATRRERVMPAGVVANVRDALQRRDHHAALALAESDDSYFAALVSAALYDAPAGFSAMIRALEQTSEELTVRRLRRVEPLNVVGNVAPMIGLFGTVYGMILAFREIVAAGGTPDPVGLAQGIGTALTTTFWGLVVAIPALAAYAFLRNKIDALTVEATREAEELINRFRPGAGPGPATPTPAIRTSPPPPAPHADEPRPQTDA